MLLIHFKHPGYGKDGYEKQNRYFDIWGGKYKVEKVFKHEGRHLKVYNLRINSVKEIIMGSLKAKIFSYCTTNINPPGEMQINAWLSQNPDIEIVNMLQSESMVALESSIERNLTVTLLYRISAS